LNLGFTRARDTSHMVVTYHQAAEEVMFLVKRFGFAVVPKALRLFAAGKQTEEVIPAITGLSVKAYDAAFAADLRARLSAYENNFYVKTSDYSDVEGLRDQIAQHPKDARAKGLLAMALIKAQKGDEAQKLIAQAMSAQASAREVFLASAELDLARKDRAGAKKTLHDLITMLHGDGYDARLWLGKIAVDEGDLDEAKKELALAKKLDPDSAEPYVLLGKALLASDETTALAELERAAELEVMDGSIPKTLVELYAKKGRWADVVRTARLSQLIDPYDVAVHTAMARALFALGKPADAREEIALADQCAPTDDERAMLKKLSSPSRGAAPKAAAPPPPSPR
jgi:tetratricopeptide (TPR) repeat protein